MRREAHRLRLLAVAVGLSLLAACVGPSDDGLGPPFFLHDLAAAGVPASCTAEDLALADALAPIADDPANAVALSGGVALCLTPNPVGVEPGRGVLVLEQPAGATDSASPAETGAPTDTSSQGNVGDSGVRTETKSGTKQNVPPNMSVTDFPSLVQDPTPQPAKPQHDGNTQLAPPPVAPPPPSNDDD